MQPVASFTFDNLIKKLLENRATMKLQHISSIENLWVLTRTQEVDSADSINQIVLNQIAGRNINTHNNQIMTFNLNGYYGPYKSDAIAFKNDNFCLFLRQTFVDKTKIFGCRSIAEQFSKVWKFESRTAVSFWCGFVPLETIAIRYNF